MVEIRSVESSEESKISGDCISILVWLDVKFFTVWSWFGFRLSGYRVKGLKSFSGFGFRLSELE